MNEAEEIIKEYGYSTTCGLDFHNNEKLLVPNKCPRNNDICKKFTMNWDVTFTCPYLIEEDEHMDYWFIKC